MQSDRLFNENDFLEIKYGHENKDKVLSKVSNLRRSIELYREMKELRQRLDDIFNEDITDDLRDLFSLTRPAHCETNATRDYHRPNPADTKKTVGYEIPALDEAS